MASGAATPKNVDPTSRGRPGNRGSETSPAPSKFKSAITYTSDIEPDDLIPVYLDTKEKLFKLDRGRQRTKRRAMEKDDEHDEEMANLRAKLERVEKDVLFDHSLAEQQWKLRRPALEKELALARRQRDDAAVSQKQTDLEQTEEASEVSGGEVNEEAERIAAEILAQGGEDDGEDIAGLFTDLPTQEIDKNTGATNIVMSGSDGIKVTIRDFGKWSGVSPVRALEEACRSRYVWYR